jgi:hypothetical protein
VVVDGDVSVGAGGRVVGGTVVVVGVVAMM